MWRSFLSVARSVGGICVDIQMHVQQALFFLACGFCVSSVLHVTYMQTYSALAVHHCTDQTSYV